MEKRLLFNSEDYKLEDPTDVKVMARIQQEGNSSNRGNLYMDYFVTFFSYFKKLAERPKLFAFYVLLRVKPPVLW